MRRKKIIQFYKCIQFVIVRVKHEKEERGEKNSKVFYTILCVCVCCSARAATAAVAIVDGIKTRKSFYLN